MEKNQIKYIVYCTTNIVNNKIYIGVHKTTNPDKFDGYLGEGSWASRPSTYQNKNYAFHLALKKYGPSNFRRTTIKVFDIEDDAFDLEAEIVNEEFLKRTDVYNIALGGKNGSYISTEIPLYQYDDKGNFIKKYRSYSDASRSINRNLKSLYTAVRQKSKCVDCYWTTTEYDKLDLTKMKAYSGLPKIPIFQYDKLGNYECCYDSMSDAGRVLNIHSANISKAVSLGLLCGGKYFTSTYAPTYDVSRHTQITSTQIHLYSLSGQYIRSYKNMLEAKNILGIKTNIYTAIKLKLTCGGFQWSFIKTESMPKVEPKSGKARKVGKYDKDWNLLETYKSLAECKRVNGPAMEYVIRGRNEFSKGFRYKYIDD